MSSIIAWRVAADKYSLKLSKIVQPLCVFTLIHKSNKKGSTTVCLIQKSLLFRKCIIIDISPCVLVIFLDTPNELTPLNLSHEKYQSILLSVRLLYYSMYCFDLRLSLMKTHVCCELQWMSLLTLQAMRSQISFG